jgi:RNA polymerase sigma factor (sigma-70 family)
MDVWSAVTKLPDRQRVCVVLRYMEDLTEPEIAEVLDCPVGTVKSQLSRGRAKLARLLGSDFLVGEAE